MPNDDEVADALSKAILKVVEVFERAGEGLDFRRMHRIIVATDFAGELAELSAATASGNPITPTDEEYAIAVAKVQLLPRAEDYEIVPVFGANYVLALLTPEDAEDEVGGTGEASEFSRSDLFDMVVHGLHHELCHVHDYNKQIDAFGTLMLSHYYSGKDVYISPSSRGLLVRIHC